MLTHVLGSQEEKKTKTNQNKQTNKQKKNSKRSNLQKEILTYWQSALKWGLGEVEPGSTPSCHTGELPSSVLLWLSKCLPQVISRGSGHDSTIPLQSRKHGGGGKKYMCGILVQEACTCHGYHLQPS